MQTTDCEAAGGQTGFAPAFGCAWTSANDFLHDNDLAGRRSNLYIAGGPNFSATGLRLAGNTGYHIRLVQYSDQPAVCSFDSLQVTGSAANWLCLDGGSAQARQTFNIRGASFGGVLSGNGLDDGGASLDTVVTINLDACRFVMSRSGSYVLASAAGKGTAWNLTNCGIQNADPSGNGIRCLGNDSVRNCTIQAGPISGGGVYGSGYNTASGYNLINAKVPYAGSAMPQVGDRVGPP